MARFLRLGPVSGNVTTVQEKSVLRELSTRRFRGLGDFTMSGLGRINLLVGTNNCGKTSVLEAVHLLFRTGMPWVFWSTLARRGEDLQAPRAARTTMDVGHLFEGHGLDVGSTFTITGTDDVQSRSLTAVIVAQPPPVAPSPPFQQDLFDSAPSPPAASGDLALELRWNNNSEVVTVPLTHGVGLEERAARLIGVRKAERNDTRPVEFITTAALSAEDTVMGLQGIVLTPDEDVLIRALRSIEPDIERIAPVGSGRVYSDMGGRGGVVVKLSRLTNRIPLGSMGDGMWRMLGITLSLVRAKGGILLIDEIDTGLHYTVMEQLWSLVYDAAKRFDVQVFAATHSRDCYQSLASIVQAEKAPRPEVTIQRIERGNPRAVAFTDDEITVAAEIGAEVR